MQKARYRIAWAVCMFMLLVAGCQPTPEAPPVAYKNTGLVKTVLDGSGDKEELKKQKQAIQEQVAALGGHIETVINPNERVTINVDADIISPSLDPIPLVRVKPENFSKQQFETFMDCVSGGQQKYHVYTSVDENGNAIDHVFTKEELSAILVDIKTYLGNDDLPEDIKSTWSQVIPMLEQDYETTISKADEKPYDGTLIDMEQSSTTWLKCYMGGNRAAWLMLIRYPNGYGSQMSFDSSSYGYGYYGTLEPYQGVDAQRMDMTYEEAKAKAEGFVRAVDGQDSNLTLYESDIAYQIGMLTNYTKETSPQAYAFAFARCYNGVEEKPVDYMWGNNTVIDYDRQVFPEKLYVVIDDEGIRQAYWLNYTQYLETVSEDMPLLAFDTIRQIFEKHSAQEFSWVPVDDGMPSDICTAFTIRKIELNLMIIPEKDNPGIYITVPVWDFIGDMEYDQDFDLNGNHIVGQYNASILTINAIDGTIINREQGY